MKRAFFYLLMAFVCSCGVQQPLHDFDAGRVGLAPDYSSLNAWVAHPDKMDESDRLPKNYKEGSQPLEGVDVFFVYPEELRQSARIAVFRDFLVRKILEAR